MKIRLNAERLVAENIRQTGIKREWATAVYRHSWRADRVLGDAETYIAHVLEMPWRDAPAGSSSRPRHVQPLLCTFGNAGLCLAGVGVLSGLLYATGGHDGPLVRKSVEVYDPGTNTWKQVADMNMCRRNAGKHNKPVFGAWLHLSVVFNVAVVLGVKAYSITNK